MHEETTTSAEVEGASTETAASTGTSEVVGEFHAAFKGTHTHDHSAMGSQGGDDTHSHSHSHDNDSVHSHSHANLSTKPITADAGVTPESNWHAYLFVEGLRTSDGRAAQMGAGQWRDLPLPIRWCPEDVGAHGMAVVVGSIDKISIVEKQFNGQSYNLILAEGSFDLGAGEGSPGWEAARQVQLQGGTRFVSADVECLESELIFVDSSSTGDDDDLWDLLFGDGGECYTLWTSYRLAAATIVSIPAFPQCVIAPASVPLPTVDPMEPVAVEQPAPPMLIASGNIPVSPPRSWFAKDESMAPGTNLRMTDDGRVFGYLAPWKQDHIAKPQGPNVIVNPPHSLSGYAYFMTGGVDTAEGEYVNTGVLTMGSCGHANIREKNYRAVIDHYDGGPGAVQAADVVVGEDDYGIWAAGAARPGITEEQRREFNALCPSGDWRKVGRGLEMVACLQVPVPGFPVTSVTASGGVRFISSRPQVFMRKDEQVALVAAGFRPQNPLVTLLQKMQSQIDELKAGQELLQPFVLAELDKLVA